MEVMIPTTRSPDFDFNSARTSPCSTPRAFGDMYSYLSAPTSPNRMSEFYKDFEEFTSEMKSMWEENPGGGMEKVEAEFAFDFSVDAENASCSAEELFDGGKIKPLKPPTRLQFKEDDELLKNPRSTCKHAGNERERGRGRGRSAAVGSSSSSRETRSLSPYRVSAFPSLNSDDSFSSNNSKSSRRWRLRDLLLFRSASEGHARSKENMKKYYSHFFRKHEDVKSGSSRSNESCGSVKGSSSSRKGPISAHELYYNANKAAQKDLKKKTSLPYKQGIWGRLAFGKKVGSYSH